MAASSDQIVRLVQVAADIARIATGQDGAAVARLGLVIEEEIRRIQQVRARKAANGRRARRNGRQTTTLRPARLARGR